MRIVYVRASLEACLRRNGEREEPIDERGVYVIYHEFDEPDADVTIDTDALDVAEATERVTRAIAEWFASSTS